MCLHACSYACVSMWYSAIDTIEYSCLSKKVKSEQENKVWRIMLGVVIYINRTDKNMESISRFSLQVVASEENRDPPSEQSLPRRPDGLNSELANHLSNITLRLAFTEQERKV